MNKDLWVKSAEEAKADHWGMDPRKAEFHQSCRVKRY